MNRVAPAAHPRIKVAALVVVAFVGGIVAGGQVNAVRDSVDDVFNTHQQDATAEAINVIKGDYFHSVDTGDLENASVGALIDHIKHRYHDHFSHYLTPDQYGTFKQGGRFSGVGLAVNEVPQGLRVATAYKGAPAQEAGIRDGDLITAVDGESIAGQSSDATTAKIRGPAGTQVTLTVKSPNGKTRNVTLTRREVNIPQVVGHIETVGGHKVGYVRLAGFFSGAH